MTDLIFGIARGHVGWVWWVFHQTDTTIVKVRLCDASFVRSCIVVMQLDSTPTSNPCRWLNMQGNFWHNWNCVIWGNDCSFVGQYVDNNGPLSIDENGEHSLCWTETCFQDLRAWFIVCQSHNVRKFIFHSEGEIQHSSIIGNSFLSLWLLPVDYRGFAFWVTSFNQSTNCRCFLQNMDST